MRNLQPFQRMMKSNNYIKIYDITFEEANMEAVYSNNVKDLSTENCSYYFCGTIYFLQPLLSKTPIIKGTGM